MAISIRKDFNTEIAGTILDDIQYQRGRYYYFLGRINPWTGPDSTPTDTFTQTLYHDTEVRREILFAKKVNPAEATLSTRRINWTTGTVYDQWDHTVDMSTKDFYVLTDDYRVYKCLKNGNGVASTQKPTGTSTKALEYSDGYVWKYMYTIPSFKRTKFLNATLMPVQTALTDSFYNNGKVQDVVVVNSGAGYNYTQYTQISVDDTGVTTGVGATAHPVIGALGTITSVVVDTGGSGYTKGATVTVIGNGTGAIIEPVIAAGVITGFTVVNGGVSYDEFTTIVISVGGATFVPKISATGIIVGVITTNAGSGYTAAPTLTVTQPVSGTGTGAYGNATALFNAVVYNGKVVHVNPIDPGIGYPIDATTNITVSGTGTGAAFTPVIDGGRIIDVVIDEPGTGYTSITLTVNSATGSGAILRGVITPSDYQSDQNVVEQTTIDGAIHAVKVTDTGTNYSENTTVTIVGNGTGATAYPVIVNSTIADIKVTNVGSGYTFANIVITDPLRPTELIPVGERANAYAILAPYGGHGYNAVKELFANTLSISTPMRNELVDLSVAQDFRTFGVIKNPKSLITGTSYYGIQALVAYKLKMSNTTGMVKDEILLFGDDRFRVVELSTLEIVVIPLDRDNVIPIGSLQAASDNLRQYTSLEVLSSVDFDKYSGELLYVSTEPPFTFGDEQSLILKTNIKF